MKVESIKNDLLWKDRNTLKNVTQIFMVYLSVTGYKLNNKNTVTIRISQNILWFVINISHKYVTQTAVTKESALCEYWDGVIFIRVLTLL